ncbi:GNAT family N-acetyltransferase [Flavobacterium sp.]|uniref:GNAT family N-acetyltransferase n=1 Tax=Flavobacterium sp. TaxID=239 RepID=UPI00286C9FAA|nr:GNAT family N-acetyltransferase [Flavobacterium sp.]
MIVIKKITADELYPIRHEILRKGETFEKCIYPNDNAASTFHLGLYEDAVLAGVVSVFQTKSVVFKDEKQFQIRGMAVLNKHQKKGYGAALVREVESYLKANENNYTLWFNARIIAVGFYEKMGFEKIGNAFEIDTIGIHYIMYKKQHD